MTLKASRTSAFLTGVVTVFLLFLVENFLPVSGTGYAPGPAHIILIFAFLIAITLFVFGVDLLSRSWQQFRQQGLFPDWDDQMAVLREVFPRFLMLFVGAMLMAGILQLWFMFGL